MARHVVITFFALILITIALFLMGVFVHHAWLIPTYITYLLAAAIAFLLPKRLW